MVDKFCKDEKKTKGKDFECCDKKKREELYSCFALAAPDPEYIMTNALIPPPTLESFCDVQTSLQSVYKTLYSLSMSGPICMSQVKNCTIITLKITSFRQHSVL